MQAWCKAKEGEAKGTIVGEGRWGLVLKMGIKLSIIFEV